MSNKSQTITKAKKSTIPLPTLKLQLRRRVQRPRRLFLFSWNGLEHKRQEMQRLAHSAVEKHKILDAVCKKNGWDLPGLVLSYVRDSNSVSYCREAVEVGQLHVAMRDLQYELVWVHNLDFDFVQREAAIILDPTPVRVALYDALIKKNMKKR